MADRAVGIPFAKEGIPFIGAAVGVTLLAGWLGWIIAAVGGGDPDALCFVVLSQSIPRDSPGLTSRSRLG